MRFFPALTEAFSSPLPPAELLLRVRHSVQEQQEFTGTVATDGFTVSRVIDYRNSMLPRIEGEVAARPGGGSRLRLRHRLHPFVLGFAALWLGGVGSVVAAMGLALLQGAFQKGSFRTVLSSLAWPDLIPVAMLAVGVLLFTVPFWAEVRQSRPLLIKLLRLESEAAATPGDWRAG